MPSALLAARERTEDGRLSATLDVAGKSLLQWQAELALGLDCDRIVCLCEQNEPEIIRVQTAIEAVGASFHIARSPSQVAALVPATDDLLVVRDSLFIESKVAILVAGKGPTIASIKVKQSEFQTASHIFERIDGEQVWSGLARIPSSLARKLADFPPDNDPMSLLLRLALQSGIKPAAIENAWLADKEWVVVRADAEVGQLEAHLFDRAAEQVERLPPSVAVASTFARNMNLATNPHVAASIGVLGLGALVSAVPLAHWFGAPTSAIVLAMGSLLIGAHSALVTFSDRLFKRSSVSFLVRWGSMLRDLLIAAAMMVSGTDMAAAAIALFAVGLIRLAEQSVSNGTLRAIWQDRPMQLLVLAISAYFGQFETALIALGVAAMITCFIQRQPR